jgi:hypothetical protein
MRPKIIRWIALMGYCCIGASLLQLYWPGTTTGVTLVIVSQFLKVVSKK